MDHQAEGAAMALTPVLHLEVATTLADEDMIVAEMTVVQADTTAEEEGVATVVAEEMGHQAMVLLLNPQTTAGIMLT